MAIGGGGLNGNNKNAGFNSTAQPAIANNPSLAGSNTNSSGTPGVGGVSSGSQGGFGGGLDNSGGFSINGSVAPSQTPVNQGGGTFNLPAYNATLGAPAAPTAASMIAGKTDPSTAAPATPAAPASNAGPAIYGLNGNQTLADWQKEQADTFNANQLAAQGQFNNALSGMPYNTQISGGNPYDQYVTNPATPGQASAAFSTPANAAAWNASGLNSQLANPTGTFQSQGADSSYANNQLNFLLNTLQRYGGVTGQNQFGNGFSPLITGQSGQTQGGLSQAASNGNTSGGLNLQTLLPLLMGLAQQNQGPAAGSYGNLGVTPQSDIRYPQNTDPNL